MNQNDKSGFDDDDDLRLRNQLRKIQLAAKYGAHFSEGESKPPGKIEEQWLNYIEEFERQFAEEKRTTVRAFVGNPSFKSLSEIPSEQLERELSDVLDFLELHGVSVSFLTEVPDAEAYRFLTEELLNKEMDDIRIEGMMHCFTYEDYHPNDEYDVKFWTHDFLSTLFWLEADLYSHLVAKENLLDEHGDAMSHEHMLHAINQFRSAFQSFERPVIELTEVRIEHDDAFAQAHIEWSGKTDNQSPPLSSKGTATLRLRRCSYGGWDVYQAIVPGWNGEL